MTTAISLRSWNVFMHERQHFQWRYPKVRAWNVVSLIDIMPCNIIGYWDASAMIFKLDNGPVIEALFHSFYKNCFLF